MTNPLTVCLTGGAGEDASGSGSGNSPRIVSPEDVAKACMVSGSGLLVVAGVASFAAALIIFCCVRSRRGDLAAARASTTAARLIAVKRADQLDRAARVAYICGILHICTCLCFWMILSRTPYYYVVACFTIGICWMSYGTRLTKQSDRLLSQSEEMDQLLLNLLDDFEDEATRGGAPAGPPPVAPPLPGESASEISEEDFGFHTYGSRGGAGEEKSMAEEVPMADEAVQVESDEDAHIALQVLDDEEDEEEAADEVAEELVRFGRQVGQGSGDQGASPEEEKEREEEPSLPIAIGEAVDFAEGEDPFDDSTDSSALEDEDEYSEGD